MNRIVEQEQESYRRKREQVSFNIIDVGAYLNELAEKGLVWALKGMTDLSEPEDFLIEKYLSIYRANQIYDNLEETFNIQTLNGQPIVYHHQTFHSKKSKQEDKTKKQQTQYLEVKDVKKFIGYQKAKELEEKIYELCKSFPSYEKRHIVNQIERSSTSIKDRIAIGEQRFIGEKFYQYSISVGSAKETSAWLQISLGQKYITQGQYDELDNLANQVVSILTKTLCHLRDNEGKGIDLPNPYTPDVKKFGAYQNALLLVGRIYEITRQREFWQERDLLYGIRSCATSTVANIAEGHQLYAPVKFRFFNHAIEALSGLESKLEAALAKEIISIYILKETIELMKGIRNILTKRMRNISDSR
ncbi:four helix bundle protein [Bacillus andreraoultii]|uniref:four helix bundle protein n=1 Tax=Bacillus andreraoultii TaxID=1499685 RepID=UPI000539F20C|nr:four helix bundle protein [Bacillus andreraoultii]